MLIEVKSKSMDCEILGRDGYFSRMVHVPKG